MADDLPEISQDFNTPLPQVDPNSALVPYRMSRTDPSGQEVVTTGYGPRARPPIQPPAGFGGGVGMPDLDRIYQAAFSKLPVDQAVKAVEAASRYLGQRGYQRDLASGADATQAFAKWAPMMFHQATGIPEAFQAQIQRQRLTAPPTQQQIIQNRLNQARFDAAQAAAKQRQATDAAKQALSERKQAFLESKPDESVTETYKIPAVEGQEAQPASKGFLGFGAHPAVPAVEPQPERTIRKTTKVNPKTLKKSEQPPVVSTKEDYDALKSGDIYFGKDGRKYRKP